MPLFKIFDAKADSKIGVWEITESLDELKSETCDRYSKEQESFTNESRKKQWLASRIILQKLLRKDELRIEHNENGKPFLLDSNYHISISHTNDFVAVIISKSEVGIDIEKIHPRIHKTRKRFVSEREESWLKNSNFIDEKLYLIWGAKEAMLKIVGDRRIDFQKNMWVESFHFSKQGCFVSRIEYLKINKKFTVEYQQINNHLLVYIVN